MKPIKKSWGGRRLGAGRKKTPTTQVKDAIDAIDVPACLGRLEQWAQGNPVICPFCGRDTGIKTADTVAIQADLELLNRKLGKSRQVTELDITHRHELTGDQCDALFERAMLAHKEVEMLGEWKDETDND